MTPEPELATTRFGATSSPAAAQVASVISRHAIWLSAAGAAVVVAVGLVGGVIFRGDAKVAADKDVAIAATILDDPASITAGDGVGESAAPPEAKTLEAQDKDRSLTGFADAGRAVVNTPVLPTSLMESPIDKERAIAGDLHADGATPVEDDGNNVKHVPRTLSLEPVAAQRASVSGNDPSEVEYPTLSEGSDEEIAMSAAVKPQAANKRSTDDTETSIDVAARLDVVIADINLPEMALERFVEFASDMADVSIELDPSVAARPDHKVRVQASKVTLGELLTKTLAAQGLQWQERGGKLIVRPLASKP